MVIQEICTATAFCPIRVWLYLVGPCNSKMASFMKSLPPQLCHYHATLKLWRWDFVLHERVSAALQAPDIGNLQLEDLPKFLLKGLRAFLRKHDGDFDGRELCDGEEVIRIPSQLSDLLLPFQREGVLFTIRRGGRALIGDDMGQCVLDRLSPLFF